MAVADADAGFIRPNEEQAMTATDDSPKAVTGNFLEPLNASLNGHTIKLAPERHREEVLPARKSVLSVHAAIHFSLCLDVSLNVYSPAVPDHLYDLRQWILLMPKVVRLRWPEGLRGTRVVMMVSLSAV